MDSTKSRRINYLITFLINETDNMDHVLVTVEHAIDRSQYPALHEKTFDPGPEYVKLVYNLKQ